MAPKTDFLQYLCFCFWKMAWNGHYWLQESLIFQLIPNKHKFIVFIPRQSCFMASREKCKQRKQILFLLILALSKVTMTWIWHYWKRGMEAFLMVSTVSCIELGIKNSLWRWNVSVFLEFLGTGATRNYEEWDLSLSRERLNACKVSAHLENKTFQLHTFS